MSWGSSTKTESKISPEQREYIGAMQQFAGNYMTPFAQAMYGVPSSQPYYYVGQGGQGAPQGGGGGQAWGQQVTNQQPAPAQQAPTIQTGGGYYQSALNDGSDEQTWVPPTYGPDPNWQAPPQQANQQYAGAPGAPADLTFPQVAPAMQYFANTPMYQISPQTQQWLNGYQDYAAGAAQQLQQNPYALTADGSAFQNPVLQSTAGMLQDAYGYIRNPQFSYQGANIGIQGVNGGGMFDPAQGVAPEWVSPEAAIAAAQKHFDTISMPGLSAAAASMGAGRSGAELQLGEEAGTRLSLPITQLQMQLEQSARNEGAKNLTAADIANAQASAQLGSAWTNAGTQAAIAQGQIAAQQNLQYNNLLNAALQNSQNLTAQYAPQVANWGAGIVGSGANYALMSPQVISALAQSGITASQMPEQYFAQNLGNQQNMLLALLGLQPLPGGGSQTQYNNPGIMNSLHTFVQDASSIAGSVMGGMSTQLAKEDVSAPLDARAIVEDTLKVPVRTWRYKWDAGDRRRIGPILEQMPAYWRENKAMFDGVTVLGALLLTVQYLAARLDRLEGPAMTNGLPWPIPGE